MMIIEYGAATEIIGRGNQSTHRKLAAVLPQILCDLIWDQTWVAMLGSLPEVYCIYCDMQTHCQVTAV
jgi:hypothetical protein